MYRVIRCSDNFVFPNLCTTFDVACKSVRDFESRRGLLSGAFVETQVPLFNGRTLFIMDYGTYHVEYLVKEV